METAAWVAWPSAVGAAEVVRSGAEAAAGVVAQPGAGAVEAEPAAVVARAAQDVPEGELLWAVAWAFRQDPVLTSVPL